MEKNIKTIIFACLGGIAGAVLLLVIAGGFLYYNKKASIRVASFLTQNTGAINEAPNILTDIVGTNTDIPFFSSSKVVAKLSISDVVKKANPAVVSIIITQEVPKYEIISNGQNTQPGIINPNDPFSFFNLFNQQPIYRQNGTEKKDIGGGSGFIVSDNGYVVTNKHVIAQDNVTYTVVLQNGKKYPAKVIARDAVLDIGLLKISGFGFPTVTLGNSDTLELGEQVVAIGNALAQFENSVSQGIVSGLGRSITAQGGMGGPEALDKVIQTDAAINPGNSGGPLLNMRGEVVGVNVAVAQGGQNIAFSLPINTVKSVISSVVSTGKIVRPYIGIRYAQINADMKAKNNLSVDYGIIVRRGSADTDLAVIPNSPADKAGIVENDIILSVDGVKLDENSNFAVLVRAKRVGDVLNLRVLSKGVERTVQVRLEQAPQ